MIENVTTGTASDWYAEARRRAVSTGRRRRAAEASREWPEFAPPVALSDGPLGAVQAADREIARQTARRARAVAEFAATRPATADRAQGEPGAMSAGRWATRPDSLRQVSEWAGRELVVALSIGAEAAEALLRRSLDLVHRLPGTLAALEAGALHPGHLWTMLDKVAPIDDARVRAEVEAELLRWAAGRVVSPGQLNDKARREVITRDARAAVRRLAKALAKRGVFLRPHDDDGMATLTVVTTMPEAQALYRALIACAESLDEDDDPRPRAQKMVACLLDLVLRPGEHDLPPVQVLLTVVASIATLAGGDAPGEVDGHVVPAEMIRQLLAALAAVHSPAPQADGEPARVPDGQERWEEYEQAELTRWWAEMERRVLAGEPAEPDVETWAAAPPGDDADASDRAPSGDDLVDGLADMPAPDTPAPDMPPAGTSPADAPPTEAAARSVDPGQAEADPDHVVEAAGREVHRASQAVARAQAVLDRARRTVEDAVAADAADEAAWRTGPGGRLTAAGDALSALRSATATQRELVAGLLARTAGGGLAERPRIALTDALSGALLALTDLPGLRRAGSCGASGCRRTGALCEHDLIGRPGLGPPGPTDGYRPSAELDRWTRARDRRCRFPGCRRRVPRGGELDHALPYPAGPTRADNLVGYCTTDHRGKHQAPGWRHRLGPDGTLTVTTPTGLVAVTTPPPY